MTPDEELRPDRRGDVPFQERTALIDGARIYGRDNPGEGNPIPLIHGPLDNLHLHDGVVPHLISTRRVVSLRFPRWGASDKPHLVPSDRSEATPSSRRANFRGSTMRRTP